MSGPAARIASILITIIILAVDCPRTLAATTAQALLQSSGFEGGVIVCWGCDEELPLTALAVLAPCRVQGLAPDAERVDALHRQIVEQKAGKNVSVCHWNQPLLPYADNSVNLLIVQVPLDEHSRDMSAEILRVLVPSGKAIIKKAGNAKCVAALGKPEVVTDAFVMVTKNPWDLSSLMYHDGILYFWQGQSQAKEQNAYKIYSQDASSSPVLPQPGHRETSDLLPQQPGVCGLQHRRDRHQSLGTWHVPVGDHAGERFAVRPGDSLYFGTSDGYVYCLKQSDGTLCWRFNANPAYRRMISFGQLESAWPIHGSVLVPGNTVIFVAGRSTFIDGGLELYKLDATTGTVIDQQAIATVDYRVDTTKDPPRLGWGTTADLLVSDGTTIHLKSPAINTVDFTTTCAPWAKKMGNSRSYPGTPLLALGGFLDDSLYDREGWCLDGQYGKIFAFNGEHAYWTQWLNQVNTWHQLIYNVGTHRYQVCSGHRQSPPKSGQARRPVNGRVRPTPRRWETPVDVRVTALALAGNRLYCAGVPASADVRSLRSAIEGKQGGLAELLDSETGNILATARLPAAPMWDGMAVADGALFICLKDGRLIRLQ